MASVRRRILRPILVQTPPQPQHRQLQRWRARLAQERVALARWQTRLKRAINALAKHQKAITRLERQLTRTEESQCLA